jgi:hypothetical protein
MRQSNPSAGGIIGIGVAGLVAYLGYNALKARVAAPAAPAGPAVMTPSGTITLPAVATPVSPAGGWSAGERDALVKRAAAGDLTAAAQADALGWTLNADQWNYYRAAGGGGQTTVDLFPEGNRGAPLTARDYLERRRAAGLSGFGIACWGC